MATQAIISLCTFGGAFKASALIARTAPAWTISHLFSSELAARFLKVEIAWWETKLSSNAKCWINGSKKPAAIIGDAFVGSIDMLWAHAAAERISGGCFD